LSIGYEYPFRVCGTTLEGCWIDSYVYFVVNRKNPVVTRGNGEL
jgi:hypothetical protein